MNKSTNFHSQAPSIATDSLESSDSSHQGESRILPKEHDHSEHFTPGSYCESSNKQNAHFSATSAHQEYEYVANINDSDVHHVQARDIDDIDEHDLLQLLTRIATMKQQEEDDASSSYGSSGSSMMGEAHGSFWADTKEHQFSGMSLLKKQDILLARYVDRVSSHIEEDDFDSDSDSEDSINVYKRRLGDQSQGRCLRACTQVETEWKDAAAYEDVGGRQL